ncbi:MAG: hypothetical protein A2075_04925 [Geobacteraceae bacterium GWC2_58_44]|nr:MAG: hypothetical protein A2075_04925 [Geobacteraceae bacterium GWC2_58_44]HBG08143.1 hypothetical protein [Geobacter sp.]
MVAVRDPVVPGANANWPGVKENFEEVSLTPVVATAPLLVVTIIVSSPADSAVISVVSWVSVVSLTMIETFLPLQVTDSADSRFCPVILTSIFEPRKSTLGAMAVIIGTPPEIVVLVVEFRLPTSS